MAWLLDTDICIYIIKRRPSWVAERLAAIPPGEVAISAVTLFELQAGVEKSAHPERNRRALEHFAYPLDLIPFDEIAAHMAARVRADLERRGCPIGPYDVQIAATALAHGLTLVSNNTREFGRIDGLVLENWVE